MYVPACLHLLLLATFLTGVQAQSIPCVSGVIITNTTWHATNSPVRVCGDITIQRGITLTIEAGVVVQFDHNVTLTVSDGAQLLAEGNETNRILFTRSPSVSNWNGLRFEGSEGSPESRISYAHFEFNDKDAVHSVGGTLFLDHLTFGNTDQQYVSLDFSSFVISNCHFPAGTTGFEPVHGTGGIKNGGRGIFLRNFFAGALGYNDLVDFTGGHRPGPIVEFIDNVFVGGQDDGLDLDGTDAWVEGNIFLHIHRNGGTPDSSAAVSGGSYGAEVSNITILGNIFFDCDNAITAKEGNFYSVLNNTILHTTKTGGVDFASGVLMVQDTIPSPSTFGRGLYVENNIIWDAEQLVRNYDPAQTLVTLTNNIVPMIWEGPGSLNVVVDPLFVHVPELPETQFTNWIDAQRIREWLSLQSDSPGKGRGWEGNNLGGVIPIGAMVTRKSVIPLLAIPVGINRTGNGIVAPGWPAGTGYTAYKWRLDGQDWSSAIPITEPIRLLEVTPGTHQLEIVGKRDSGSYQDDPIYAEDALVTTLTLGSGEPTLNVGIRQNQGQVILTFQTLPNTSYRVEYKTALGDISNWTQLSTVPPTSTPSTASVTYTIAVPQRYYRVVGLP